MLLGRIANHYFKKPTFKKFLKPVEPVEGEDGMYFLADGSLGYMVEVAGVNIEGQNVDQISDNIAKVVSAFPKGYAYQFLLYTFKGCEGVEKVCKTGEFEIQAVKRYMNRKMMWHNKGMEAEFAREGTSIFAPRTIKTYLTVKEPGRFRSRSESEYREAINKFRNICHRITVSMSTMSYVSPVKPDEMISIFYKFLNPARSINIRPQQYQEGADMRKSFVYSSITNGRKGLYSDGHLYKVISFGQLPIHYDQDKDEYFTRANVLFEEKSNEISFLDIADSMLVAFNFEMLDPSVFSAKLEAKRSMAKKHEVNVIGGTDAIDKQMQGEDTAKLLGEIYKGNNPVSLGIHVILPLGEEDESLKTQEVLTFLNSTINANAFIEDLIDDAMLLRCMPFGYDYKINPESMVQRNIDCTVGNLADLSPLYRHGRKVVSPLGMVAYNRRGELLTIDLFDKNTALTSPHMLVTGKTGSGKSVTMCDFILQSLRQPAKVIVIDKEISYRTACRISGGQMLVFEGIPDVKMDPFVGDYGDDHRSRLVNILALMQAGSYDISQDDRAVLSQAIAQVARTGRASMRAVVNCLEKDFGDEGAKAVARRLYMYYEDGQYARFVEGNKPNLDIHNDFTLFELADIDTYKDLQTVVVALLIHYITEYVKKVPGRKYLILDEVHTLLKNDIAVDYLVGSVKTFRKYSCSVVFVTQQLEDFKHIAKALNMKKNCPNQILFYQDYQEIEENAQDLGMSRDQLRAYRTVRKHRSFSEAMFKMEDWTSIGRISLDPESYWISSSTRDDREYLEKLIKEKQIPLEDALLQASKNYPYGVPSSTSASVGV